MRSYHRPMSWRHVRFFRSGRRRRASGRWIRGDYRRPSVPAPCAEKDGPRAASPRPARAHGCRPERCGGRFRYRFEPRPFPGKSRHHGTANPCCLSNPSTCAARRSCAPGPRGCGRTASGSRCAGLHCVTWCGSSPMSQSPGHTAVLLSTVSRKGLQKGVQVLHEQEQVARIGGARLELQGFLPDPSFIVLGMHEERPDAGDLGGFGRSEQRVLDQCLAQPLSLTRPAHREAGEKHDGDRISGQALAHPGRGVGRLDGACCKTVVPDHSPSPADSISTSASGALVRKRETLQETIERLLPAVESINLVVCGKLFDQRRSLAAACHSSTLFPASNRARRGLSVTGRSSTSWKARHASSSSRNSR